MCERHNVEIFDGVYMYFKGLTVTITVKLLIEKGADIYAKNNEGKTAIHECFREAPFFNFYSSVSALVKGKILLL